MRSSLDQHLFGLLVVFLILPVCAAAFLLASPYLCFRSYHGSVPPSKKSPMRHTIGRRKDGRHHGIFG